MILQRRRDISGSERLTDSTPLSCFVWGHDILVSFCTRMLSVFCFSILSMWELVLSRRLLKLNWIHHHRHLSSVCGCVSNVWCCRLAALTIFCFDSQHSKYYFFSTSARIIFFCRFVNFHATVDFFALRIIEFNWTCVLKKNAMLPPPTTIEIYYFTFYFSLYVDSPPSSHRVELQQYFHKSVQYSTAYVLMKTNI